VSSSIICPISRQALEDFLYDDFRISSAQVPALEILVEKYRASGGTLTVQDFALMAGNVCPETGKMFELPGNLNRTNGWPKDPIFPRQKLQIMVKNLTGWEPIVQNG
jgi:hypothetical protein